MDKKLGLVMTGGGARAAYQAGVTRALYELMGAKKNLFDVLTGNSAGAINATYLAANCENWDVSTHNLSELWARVTPQNIYDLRTKAVTDLGLRWVSGTAFGGLTPKGSSVNHLLDTKPLRKLADREIDFRDIETNVRRKNLHGIALSATNYNSGTNVIFYQGQEEISDWLRTDRFSSRTELKAEHMMASAAIPFFFPPVQIGQSYYGDGCIRQTTPLSPAIHLGADKLIAIGVRHSHDKEVMRNLSFSPFSAPTMGQIIGTMLNSIFMDSLEADVERVRRFNELVAGGKHKDLKEIPILMLRPSRDLGKMTANLTPELPLILRYLLKGIGVSDTEGLDLLSYLAFDVTYTKPLMELGYEDTFKKKSEVLKFIDA